jgi:hypothetical protein
LVYGKSQPHHITTALVQKPVKSVWGFIYYFTPRLFAALASPEPRVPRSPPRAAPPLPAGAPLPAPPILDAGAGVENLGVAFEDVGGFSTKDVSVVL